jgi:hypothetical protein
LTEFEQDEEKIENEMTLDEERELEELMNM